VDDAYGFVRQELQCPLSNVYNKPRLKSSISDEQRPPADDKLLMLGKSSENSNISFLTVLHATTET